MLRSLSAFAPVALVAEKPVLLVVEENAVFRSANAERLRAAGFEVLEAANSAEAELVLKSTTVDALFVPVRRG
jgi:DNA-binding response OmpR family regulator